MGLDALERDPGDLRLAGLVGVELMRTGQVTRGRPLVEAAGRALHPERDVRFFLARAAHERGDAVAAQALLEAEVDAYPNNAAGVLALALLLGQRGDWPGQLEVVTHALDRARAAPAPPGDTDILGALRGLQAGARNRLAEVEARGR
jgi:thioredoxin-like negative regulator of GroEL